MHGAHEPHDAVQAALERAEFWCYPGRFRETHCNSAVEAQLRGCVCVYSAVGALPEIVGDRGVGVRLVEEGRGGLSARERARPFVEALDRLMGPESFEEKSAMRARGRAYAQSTEMRARASAWSSVLQRE